MHAYRDKYAQVFNGGKNVVLIAISADSPEELASWASDDDFPFLLATDEGWSVAARYGVPLRENGFLGARSVVVIDSDGKIAWSVERFQQGDDAAYAELQAAIEAVTHEDEDEGE
jgi:peroxiredoxin